MLSEKENEDMENDLDYNMNHVIMNFVAYISKPFYYMGKMIAELKAKPYFLIKEKIKEMLTEKDHEERENGKDLKMKHGEIKLSKFGLGSLAIWALNARKM